MTSREGRPEGFDILIKQAALGDDEARAILRRAGKKGGETRALNMEINKTVQNFESETVYDELYESELNRLKKAYPEMNDEGVPVTEEWYADQAEKLANAIITMRERQNKLRKIKQE